MKKPIIGITTSFVDDLSRPGSPTMQGQFFTYVDAIVHAGGAPMLIPSVQDTDTLKVVYDQCDGILFSGGWDISATTYGGSADADDEHVSSVRDSIEMQLIKWVESDNKPTFGICRGMQLMNIHRGGTLISDIESEEVDHLGDIKNTGLDSVSHTLNINSDSKLSGIIGGTTIRTNTYHHQAIDKLGMGLVVTATAEDGVVEALEDPTKKFWIGVQSHPESIESTTAVEWAKVFKAFIESSADD